MPKGIPNKKPTPPPVEEVAAVAAAPEVDEDAELARLIAEDDAAKAASDADIKAQAEARAEQARTAEAKAVLMKQAEALDMTIDNRWSAETLAEKVLAAQEAKKAADEATFIKAAKVWVYLLRGAYPTEDQKHFAGETIQVTPEIAERWYEAGVARPGKAV
jgi:hypothetical protein